MALAHSLQSASEFGQQDKGQDWYLESIRKPNATYTNMLLHEGLGCLCSASYELMCQHGKTDV